MAVSGSKNFAITRADIIDGALRKIGVIDANETASGEDTTTCNFALNLMVKEMVNEGIDLFLRTESTLFLQPDTNSYDLSTDHITDSYVETTLNGDHDGDASIEVTSTTGMTVGDFFGVKLDSNTIYWTTISDIPVAGTVTMTTGTALAASDGNKVYAYTTKSDRPQKILYAYRSDKNGFDTEVRLIGENEYRSLSNKTSDGPPVEIWYNPQGNQSAGKLHVWPDDGGSDLDKLVLICQHLPDDFDSGSDSPDFPIEFGNVLVWSLAAEIATEYGLSEAEQGRLWQIAQHKIDRALDYSQENASVEFALDRAR